MSESFSVQVAPPMDLEQFKCLCSALAPVISQAVGAEMEKLRTEMRQSFKDLKSEIENGQQARDARLSAAENRIRTLEQGYWRSIGAIGAFAFLIEALKWFHH